MDRGALQIIVLGLQSQTQLSTHTSHHVYICMPNIEPYINDIYSFLGHVIFILFGLTISLLGFIFISVIHIAIVCSFYLLIVFL